MKKYIFRRLVRSVLSIFLVVTIAIVMVYTLIPRMNVFRNDTVYTKLGSKGDDKARYVNIKLESLGYINFDEQKDMCSIYYTGDEYNACMEVNSTQIKEIVTDYEDKGWEVLQYKSGLYYVQKDVPIYIRVINWFSNLITFDHPWKVTDIENENLARKIYVELDHNNIPSIKCSGCEHKYLLYFNSSFPFIHQNFVKLDLGYSYPTYSGTDIVNVMGDDQGTIITSEMVFETGVTAPSAFNLHSCQYKQTSTLDTLDTNKFYDNYANCKTIKSDFSMINISMVFGVLALILSYVIGLPMGMLMASRKDKFADKIGTVYVNFMIAVPSLAFIYFTRLIGTSVGLADKFPVLGAHDIRSYILPVIVLGLMSSSGLIIWSRRYMIDQANSDYVKFARAKGLSEKEIFKKHILKNAIVPIANGLPSAIILTISGAVITETVFAIPGMGKLLPDSIGAYNNNMIIALTFIFTSLSILSVLFGDILITLIDPRINLAEKKDGSK